MTHQPVLVGSWHRRTLSYLAYGPDTVAYHLRRHGHAVIVTDTYQRHRQLPDGSYRFCDARFTERR